MALSIYSLVYKDDKIVKETKDVNVDDKLDIVLKDGKIKVNVLEIKNGK